MDPMILWERREKLLPLLRFWCGGGERPLLTDELLSFLKQEKALLPFLWYFHHRELKEPFARRAKESYYAAEVQDIRQEMAFREIKKILNENQIPFLPIKGSDLAYRVYPSGALRQKIDLDLLLTLENCGRATELLRGAGWTTPYRYQNENHVPVMVKKRVSLELHFSLPQFPNEASEVLWGESSSLATLDTEWNLLLLLNHALRPEECNTLKLLLDFGFLLKREAKVDWAKINALASRFHIASPQFFVAAFDDFFPEGVLPEGKISPEKRQKLRKIFLSFSINADRSVLVMNAPDRFSLRWWKERFRGMGVSSIRIQTGNPEGHYGKLFWDYLIIFGKKLSLFWHHRRGSKRQKESLKEFYEVRELLRKSN